MSFELYSDYLPAGDQPQAIEKLVDGLDQRPGASDPAWA
jgi:excinuclease UvrABC helicase subunit UvrB